MSRPSAFYVYKRSIRARGLCCLCLSTRSFVFGKHFQDGDGAESWIDGPELYLLIRLYLLARDGRRDVGHGIEAEGLFGALVAEYARRGAYAAVSRGRLIYHAPSLADSAAALEA